MRSQNQPQKKKKKKKQKNPEKKYIYQQYHLNNLKVKVFFLPQVK